MKYTFRETQNNWNTGELNNWEYLLCIFVRFCIGIIIITLLFKIIALPKIQNSSISKARNSKSTVAKRIETIDNTPKQNIQIQAVDTTVNPQPIQLVEEKAEKDMLKNVNRATKAEERLRKKELKKIQKEIRRIEKANKKKSKVLKTDIEELDIQDNMENAELE